MNCYGLRHQDLNLSIKAFPILQYFLDFKEF